MVAKVIAITRFVTDAAEMTPEVKLLSDKVLETLNPHPEILEAYLFGSVAQGRATAHSDIDLAVYVRPETPMNQGFGYAAELTTDLMAAAKQNRIDLIILNHAPPLLYHRVLKTGLRLLSRNLQETTVREGQALSRYFDYLPQLRKIELASSRRLARGDFGR